MTNEEARAILEEVETIDDSMYQYNPAYLEALNMAIAALKAEPCEDTISRKHLLSEIDDLMKSPWFNRYKDDIGVLRHGYLERKEAVEVVRDLCVKAEQPVTLKPKTGKWVVGQTIGDGFTCSECNTRYHMYPMSYRFCPNCGAKMEGESEEDVCKGCCYNDGEVHAECVICDKAESEDKE